MDAIFSLNWLVLVILLGVAIVIGLLVGTYIEFRIITESRARQSKRETRLSSYFIYSTSMGMSMLIVFLCVALVLNGFQRAQNIVSLLFPIPAPTRQATSTPIDGQLTPSTTSKSPPTAIPLVTSTYLPTSIESPTPYQTPTPDLAHSRIAFVSERNGYNDIFIMYADGTGLQRLTFHQDTPGRYSFAPSFSPDGQRIAFVSNRAGVGSDEIFMMDANGSNVRRLTFTESTKENYPSWFPDGHHLAFASQRSGMWHIYRMDDNGANVQQLTFGSSNDTFPTVSPDGTKIVFVSNGELYLMNSDGINPHSILQNGITKEQLAWSPDSNSLAYAQHLGNSGRLSLYTLNLTNTQPQPVQLVPNGGWPCWSPDGTQIAFSSDMNGIANLYIYHLGSGQISRLTSTSSADYTPSWSW